MCARWHYTVGAAGSARAVGEHDSSDQSFMSSLAVLGNGKALRDKHRRSGLCVGQSIVDHLETIPGSAAAPEMVGSFWRAAPNRAAPVSRCPHPAASKVQLLTRSRRIPERSLCCRYKQATVTQASLERSSHADWTYKTVEHSIASVPSFNRCAAPSCQATHLRLAAAWFHSPNHGHDINRHRIAWLSFPSFRARCVPSARRARSVFRLSPCCDSRPTLQPLRDYRAAMPGTCGPTRESGTRFIE